MLSSPFARLDTSQPARGTSTTERSRGRARGRGRGRGLNQGIAAATTSDASKTFQSSRGSPQRAGFSGFTRAGRNRGTRGTGRGGNLSRSFNTPSTDSSLSLQDGVSPPPINPRPEDIRETNHETIAARRTKLHGQYEQHQKRAIQQKLMSDPDKREKLENAIFTKGTCTHMCDEKERVDRIFELQLDRAEMLPHPETGQLVPIEGRMVKRFRRSAAGVGKQIPEELRTPETLQRTLDYLINNVIGPNPRLAQHHKFVWDRTRAIRNDCSIQSFTQPEDVKREVDCYERIARFHILSSHLLSKPGALQGGEDFVHKQEIEQLTKTFQTLMDKYDGYNTTLDFPHEAEFRAYFILFAPMTTIADLDDQVQRWPRHVLDDGRVQTALKLRAAGESTDQPVGSRRFEPVPCFIAQKNAGLYWELLRSQRVGYLMACVAEMSFRNIRFAALDSLWRTGKSAPEKGQATMKTWTKAAMRDYLGFDDDEQVEEFCSKFDLNFVGGSSTQQVYLDFRSHNAPSLEYSSLGQDQIFSESIVESKRQGRNLVAVLNGMSIAAASRENMLENTGMMSSKKSPFAKSSMFISQNSEDEEEGDEDEDQEQPPIIQPATSLNPLASAFTPSPFKPVTTEESAKQPGWMTGFGQPRSSLAGFPAAASTKSVFAEQGGETASTGAPALLDSQGLGALQNEPAQSLSQSNAFTTPSQQGNDFAIAKPPAQSSLTSNGNPFAVQPSSGFIGNFQFTANPAEKAAPQTQAAQLTSSSKTAPNFSWASGPTPPAVTSESIFAIPKPAQPSSIKAPNFAFNPTSTLSQTQLPPTSDSIGIASSSTPAFSPFTTDKSTQPSSSIETLPIKQADPGSQPLTATKPEINKPSPAPFKFPPAVQSNLPSTTPTGSPAKPPTTFDSGARTTQSPFPVLKPDCALEAPPGVSSRQNPFCVANPDNVITANPSTVSKEPEVPLRKPIDKDQLVQHLCRIGLVQKDGILDMFVAAKVNSLCNEVFKAFQTSRLNRRIAKLKKSHLQRKFFALWRARVHLKRLQKRAEKRKRMFAASVQAEAEAEERRRKEVAFLAEIVKSEQNKRKIQEEQREREEAKNRQLSAKLEILEAQRAKAPTALKATRPQTDTTQTAGQKRKMLISKASSNNLQDIAMSPMHKRSRTVGTDLHNQGSSNPTTSVFVSRMPPASSLRRSLSHRSLHQSVKQQGVDQTESDYFRLKALGVDPNTPLIPDTAASLAVKQKKEAQHREFVLSKVKNRPSSMINKPTSNPIPVSTGFPKSISASQIGSLTQPPSRPSPSVVDESEDPFLRDLREARQAMSADAEWLKTEAIKLEKEIEQQEELRHSVGSNHSTEDFSTQSVNGLARSFKGHAYIPPVLRPGQTLSRTEQRIRATGARGLANLSIGGSPRPSSQYLPVAMSRRSASQLQRSSFSGDQITSPSNRSKRSIDEVNLDVDVRNGFVNPEQHIPVTDGQTTQPLTKKSRHEHSQGSSTTRMSIQALQALPASHENGYASRSQSHSTDVEGTEDDETGDELEYVGQAQQNGDGIYEYDDDEEQYSGDLDDNEEEEEEYTDDDDDNQLAGSRSLIQSRHGFQEEYDEDDEEEVEEEDDEEMPAYHARFGSSAPLGSGHGSRAVSASVGVATPDTGLGSTVNDAIELSD